MVLFRLPRCPVRALSVQVKEMFQGIDWANIHTKPARSPLLGAAQNASKEVTYTYLGPYSAPI